MSKPTKKLFLLDAYALIYRAHFAFSKNPRISSKGLNTGIMMGFTNTMLEVINKQKPTHIAIAFDTPKPTFRHIQFPAYKAHRDATPEDIKIGVPYVKKIIEAFNIPIVEKEGFEADDVVGTIAKQAAKQGFEVYMMTPDKDFAQLVEENIFLYKPAFMGNAVAVMGISEVLEKWDIERIDQVRDILGLHGDASDNIPGIPGVGAKTAVKYLKAYDSIEGLIENVHELKGKAKENVEKFGEQGLLSKDLATIRIDVPVEYSFDEMEYTGPDEEKVKVLFEELEFRTLTNRLFGGENEVKKGSFKPSNAPQLSMFGSSAEPDGEEPIEETKPKETIETKEHNYHLIQSKDEARYLVDYLLLQKEFCFDTETTNISAVEAELVGLSFSYVPGEAYYVPVSENFEKVKELLAIFEPAFTNTSIRKIGQNLKYDILVLKKYGVDVKGPLFDTMLAHYLIDPDSKHGMDVLAEHFLNYTPVSIKTLIGGRNLPKTMRDVPLDKIAEYAAEDADITLQLKEKIEPLITDPDIIKLMNEVELPLVQVLATVEFNGVKIDEAVLKTMSGELEEESIKVRGRIYELAGEEFNIASPKQLGVILFDKLQLVDKPKKTKTGQYATGEEILSRLENQHEIARKILEFRELQKLKSTYVDALPQMVSSFDGLIHTNYSQTVAATGRLSSLNPNLQNIPIRTPKGREIRKAFVPSSNNHVILSADYSQIELRIMAAFAGDTHMIEAFKNGRDIHATTASKIFKVPLDEVTSEMRSKAKSANFGIIYGISAFGLSQNMNIPRKEAAEIIENYFTEFTAIKTYMDKVINEARDNGYVSTVLGRKRYLRDINSRNAVMRGFAERNAINAPIQGTAADIIKVAMINIDAWMQKEKVQSKMIMQVHDELVFDVTKEEVKLMKNNIEKLMKEALPIEVPMEVGMGVGANWLEAH
ncbi:MAG: DNA polymerase I [Cyclobacteriaceae bacterium]|nr:DNA polymerase I [Cyclobacteriaceae bacterium]